MSLFQQFKRVFWNDTAHLNGNVYTNAGNGAPDVIGKSIQSAVFDGWNGTTYANTGDSSAPILLLQGFARFIKTSVSSFSISRAIPGVPQIIKIKATGNNIAPGAVALVRIKIISHNLEAEFARYNPEYFQPKRYQITFGSTLDNVEFLNKLNELIAKDLSEGFRIFFTSILIDNTNAANPGAPTGILITNATNEPIGNPNTVFAEFTFDLPAGLTISMVTDVPANDTDSTAGGGAGANVVEQQYDGRNTYEQVRHEMLETEGSNYPYSYMISYLPVRGANYTEFYIEHNSVTDSAGAAIVDQVGVQSLNRFTMYLNEGTLSLAINNIARWLDMSVAPGNFYQGIIPANAQSATANNTGAAGIEMPGGKMI